MGVYFLENYALVEKWNYSIKIMIINKNHNWYKNLARPLYNSRVCAIIQPYQPEHNQTTNMFLTSWFTHYSKKYEVCSPPPSPTPPLQYEVSPLFFTLYFVGQRILHIIVILYFSTQSN
jgi:hypothetical protein